jgi:hypothetical protein
VRNKGYDTRYYRGGEDRRTILCFFSFSLVACIWRSQSSDFTFAALRVVFYYFHMYRENTEPGKSLTLNIHPSVGKGQNAVWCLHEAGSPAPSAYILISPVCSLLEDAHRPAYVPAALDPQGIKALAPGVLDITV